MRYLPYCLTYLVVSTACLATPCFGEDQAPTPDYNQTIAPLLKKYCVACHNPQDHEGQLSLETFADLQQGGEHGPGLLPGSAASSRMIRMMTGKSLPKMPPDDSEGPTPAEIELFQAWIDAGAKGPRGAEPARDRLLTPKVPPPANLKKAITAAAWSPDGRLLAVARYRQVELIDVAQDRVARRLTDFPGKVNSVRFSADGKSLIVASGVTGLVGQATLWDVASGERRHEYSGHRDTLFAAALSPDATVAATAGYDRQIILWNVSSGQPLHVLKGHNDAVYDLAFSPDGSALASASGDETVKLWDVASGQRLDTLSQPLAEQYAVAFSPDGQFVIAGGADNRIRVWRFVSRRKPRINPLVYARFAHEAPIVQLVFSADGQALISAAEDRMIKLWETQAFTQVHAYPKQPDLVGSLALDPAGQTLKVGLLDGSLTTYKVERKRLRGQPSGAEANASATSSAGPTEGDVARTSETEPNDEPGQAALAPIPVKIAAVIHDVDGNRGYDADLFRFHARAGQQIVLETHASRKKSPADTKIEVLDEAGKPIERVMLRAVRDSYFTFRGKDSNTSDDFRLHNWREMELNEYLYANGEVVKLWHYPRGPDSGFQVYPGSGNRYGFFDTTAISHALQEPCYIVEPYPPGTSLIPNGLPVFRLYYENDDEARRRSGSDSKLYFTAPREGEYLARVTDARGFEGESFQYELTLRARRPDFKVSLPGANPTVNAGSGKEFQVVAERLDGFEGEIRVEIANAPPGFHVTSPLVIEEGQERAYGVIRADRDATPPTADNAKATVVTATARIGAEEVAKPVNNLGEIKLAQEPQLLLTLLPGGPDADQASQEVPELVIQPGQTVMARIRVERKGFQGRVSLGGADCGRNLPHGVYVDNIGLNGLLIVEGKSERTFFITAAKWVPESTRTFHVKTGEAGGQAAAPLVLHVRRPP